MRIDIPDENGVLHNILEEPRWQDVIWIPRNGGRVVFRQRYPDYLGLLVNHCHLLLHEDNGMMTGVTVTEFAEETNYSGSDAVVRPGDPNEVVDELHPSPSLSESFVASAQFIDPNHNTGQIFPGFPVIPPPEGAGESSDPVVSLSIDRINDTRVRLRWDARAGATYSLQSSTGTTPISWEEFASITADTDDKREMEVGLDTPTRLFRLVVSQP